MSVPRTLSLGAIVTLAVLFGWPLARANASPSDAGDAGDAGDPARSDPPDPPPDESVVVGGGGCTIIGRSSTPELPSLGLVAAGAALLAASRRRRTASRTEARKE
jgi:hypothetical protein